MGRKLSICLIFLVLVLFPDRGETAPSVVVGIKPIHSLVAAVMDSVGTPRLLIRGGASPHSYSLKPSDARSIRNADLIFWVGEDVETLLKKPLRTLAGGALVVEMAKVKGLRLWATREGGVWESHDDHGKDHDRKEHKIESRQSPARHETDMHIWLDPGNAKVMVRAIVQALSRVDAGNRAKYAANGEVFQRRLDALDGEMNALLQPVKKVPFIVFHDAYQYFERHYRLNAAGSITVSPERRPGARRLLEIRSQIRARRAACVFAEPQFQPALVRTVVEGTDARTGVLDPIGADLEPGPEMYFSLLKKMALSLKDCLAGSATR